MLEQSFDSRAVMMMRNNPFKGSKSMSIKAKKRHAQPVTHLLLSKREGLGQLTAQAALIERAQQKLQSSLPEEMTGHLLVGGYQNGQLTLLTDRAVWLTWLRFERVRLVTLLRQVPGLEDVTQLQFKVRPFRRPRKPLQQSRILSHEAAEHIEACAQDITDPTLRQALKRLATHATPRDE